MNLVVSFLLFFAVCLILFKSPPNREKYYKNSCNNSFLRCLRWWGGYTHYLLFTLHTTHYDDLPNQKQVGLLQDRDIHVTLRDSSNKTRNWNRKKCRIKNATECRIQRESRKLVFYTADLRFAFINDKLTVFSWWGDEATILALLHFSSTKLFLLVKNDIITLTMW